MNDRLACVLAISALTALPGCHSAPEAPPSPPAVAAPREPVPSTLEEVMQAEKQRRFEAAEAGLLGLARSPDPVISRRAVAMLGILYQNENRMGEAAIALADAIEKNPAIAPFLLIRLAQAQSASGDHAAALASIAALRASHPASTAVDTARLVLPGIHAAAADRESASAATREALTVPIDGLTEDELMATAAALDAAGFDDLAARARFRLLSAYPRGRHTEQIYRALVEMPPDTSPVLSLGYSEALAFADRLGRVNRYDQALDFLSRIQAAFPQAATDPNFIYIRASSLFNSRHYAEVTGIRLRRDQPYYLAVELLRARAFWRTDRNREFLEIVRRIRNDHPATREAAAAKILLSKYHTTDEIDYRRAAGYLEEAVASGNRGTDGENLWNLGWIYFRSGDDAKALATFDRYLAAYPDADYTSNALFWSGKTHERAGRLAERNAVLRRLIDLYPYSYFSYRAREIIGVPAVAPDEIPGREPFPSVEAASGTGAQARLAMIHELMAVDLHEEAARELQRIAGTSTEDKQIAFTLADLYAEAGQPLRANVLLQRNFRNIVRHGGSGVPHRFWEILYPRAFWDSIVESAQRSEVDPYLVTAIIRQESAFEPQTVSSAGAVGLMQIMPAEADRIAAAGGLGNSVSREDLFNPQTNIALGTAEIRQKLDAMNGEPVFAIASYNAGEEAVGRWIAKGPIDDLDVFVEAITFSETRLYVKSVTRNLYEYRRIYGSP